MLGIRIGEAEVQCGLSVEEVLDVIRASRGIGCYELAEQRRAGIVPHGVVQRAALRSPLPSFGLERRPDVIIRVSQVRSFLRLQEPLVLVGRVASHKVHNDLYAACVGLTDQLHKVGVGTEALVHPVEINHVIASVCPARHINRVQPDGRHTDGLDVIEA